MRAYLCSALLEERREEGHTLICLPPPRKGVKQSRRVEEGGDQRRRRCGEGDGRVATGFGSELTVWFIWKHYVARWEGLKPAPPLPFRPAHMGAHGPICFSLSFVPFFIFLLQSNSGFPKKHSRF